MKKLETTEEIVLCTAHFGEVKTHKIKSKGGM